jgi:hypothetical protein
MYDSLIINISIFGALQSRCPAVIFIQDKLFPDYGAIGRQAGSGYIQIFFGGVSFWYFSGWPALRIRYIFYAVLKFMLKKTDGKNV